MARVIKATIEPAAQVTRTYDLPDNWDGMTHYQQFRYLENVEADALAYSVSCSAAVVEVEE